MTIKFERLKRSLSHQVEHASTESDTLGHHDGRNSPSAPSLEQPAIEPVFIPQQLGTHTQVEALTFGRVELEMLGYLRQTLAAHRDRRLQQFFDYWLTLAQSRDALPSRQTIDPLQMPRRLIPNLFIAEVIYETGHQARYRFRLLGQEISDRGYVRPGDYLHELGNKSGSESLEPHYRDCLNGRIWLRHTNLEWSDPRRSFIHYDVLLLPLARDGRDVDAMIGLVIYNT
jgi:hypothetical protein